MRLTLRKRTGPPRRKKSLAKGYFLIFPIFGAVEEPVFLSGKPCPKGLVNKL